jgi:hypothetical protein
VQPQGRWAFAITYFFGPGRHVADDGSDPNTRDPNKNSRDLLPRVNKLHQQVKLLVL